MHGSAPDDAWRRQRRSSDLARGDVRGVGSAAASSVGETPHRRRTAGGSAVASAGERVGGWRGSSAQLVPAAASRRGRARSHVGRRSRRRLATRSSEASRSNRRARSGASPAVGERLVEPLEVVPASARRVRRRLRGRRDRWPAAARFGEQFPDAADDELRLERLGQHAVAAGRRRACAWSTGSNAPVSSSTGMCASAACS